MDRGSSTRSALKENGPKHMVTGARHEKLSLSNGCNRVTDVLKPRKMITTAHELTARQTSATSSEKGRWRLRVQTK